LILVGIEIECRFEDCFESGANQITVEVLALKTGFSKSGLRIWIDKIILGADANNVASFRMVRGI
jgi:hypothetical protein